MTASPLQPAPAVGSIAPAAQDVAPWAAPLPAFVDVAKGSVYVGTAVCTPCHSDATLAWQGSQHAHALETLVGVQADFNPSCFRCHSVGAGLPTGYTNREQTPHLEHVGCESCHGPGSAHIAAPSEPFGGLKRDATACVACHSVDNSPEFDWATYWPLVSHGSEN
jgi:hypothetical protein